MVPADPKIEDAAAAVIRLPGGRYLMQLRDQIPGIWYPGCWGCFGGATDPDESPLEALKRELLEEIELVVRETSVISRLEFDFGPLGLGKASRTYYLVDIDEAELGALKLHEGERMDALTYAQLVSGIPVVPYDAFAIHLAASPAAQKSLPRYNIARR